MRGYVLMLGVLAASWGASYMFIKVAVDDFEPTTMMCLRVLIAFAALFPLLVVASNSTFSFSVGVTGEKVKAGVRSDGGTRMPVGTSRMLATRPRWFWALLLTGVIEMSTRVSDSDCDAGTVIVLL